MIFLVCILFATSVTAGPIALITSLAMNPMVQGGMAGVVGASMLSSNRSEPIVRDPQPENSQAMVNLVNGARECAVANANLREEVGRLHERQRDYAIAKNDLRELEKENRLLFMQGTELRIDNQYKQAHITRLERERDRQQQPSQPQTQQVETPARPVAPQPTTTNDLNALLPNKTIFVVGTASLTAVAALLYAHRISKLERRIKTNDIISWQRNAKRASHKEMVQSLIDMCNSKFGPTTPERALAQLQSEIAKCIRLLQQYLSWKPWQDSIVGSFLGLDEAKFAQCELYLGRLLVIQASLQPKKEQL